MINCLPASFLVVWGPVVHSAVAPDLHGPVAHLHSLISRFLVECYLALFLEDLFTHLKYIQGCRTGERNLCMVTFMCSESAIVALPSSDTDSNLVTYVKWQVFSSVCLHSSCGSRDSDCTSDLVPSGDTTSLRRIYTSCGLKLVIGQFPYLKYNEI